MSAVGVPPVPYKTPLLDTNGILTVPWIAWFRQLFLRVGGNDANLLNNPMTGIGDIIYGGTSGAPTQLAADVSNTRKFLRELSVVGVSTPPVWDTLLAADIPALNYVTSIAMTVPTIMSIAGSPITSNGTLALSLATQLANQVFAGPTSGGAVAPTFRSLVSGDIPALAYVTSVALTAPNIFSIAGSPITSNGTLAVTLANQSANKLFAGPASGSATAPTFRSAVPLDTLYAIAAKSADYTLTTADQVVTFDATTGNKTATLPTAVGFSGLTFTIKKIDNSTNTVPINTTSAQTIDGIASGSITLATQYESLTVISDGANWAILNHKATTPWAAYTPTTTGFGTASNVAFFWRRLFDTLHVQGTLTSGTVTAALGSFSLPSALAIDTTKIPIANTTANPGPQVGLFWTNVTNQIGAILTATGTSTGLVYTGNQIVASGSATPTNASSVFNGSQFMSINFSVPISGWFGA